MQCRDEIERFVAILQNPSPALKSCAAFALFQFTIPGGRFAAEHMKLLRDVGAPEVLRLHQGAPVEARYLVTWRRSITNCDHIDALNFLTCRLVLPL
ncbi:hypothetical protein OROGR_028302 [Orobanche gracilis]